MEKNPCSTAYARAWVGWPRRVGWVALLAASLAVAGSPARAQLGASPPGPGRDSTLQQLVVEALNNNPEIVAAAHERSAAGHRILPAGALEDPMLEAGLINVPVTPWRLNREDMTMKMLGISQKLPYPGKRGLRQDIAAKDAESLGYGYRETVNRVVRDVKIGWYDLALIDRNLELLQRNRQLVEQLLRIAESRYGLGQGTQAEVLKAQAQLAKMSEELLRMGRERRNLEADLARFLGRVEAQGAIRPSMPSIESKWPRFEDLRDAALSERPQLLGLQAMVDKNQKALELARKDNYPDFDLRFQYGQREKTLEGVPRIDLFSFTVAMNLPVWESQKRDPRVAEAQSLRAQTLSLLQGQQNDILARLRQQLAIVEQSGESAGLYEKGILPQSRLALESAMTGYRVNRVDFQMLLDSQMTLLGYEVGHAATVIAQHKALAEIDQLVGKSVAQVPAQSLKE